MRSKRFAVVGLVAFAVLGCGEPQKYTDGKDTVESFGDGTWTIAKTGGGPNDPRKLSLHSRETRKCLSEDLVDWKRKGNWVYALDAGGNYIVLNFRTSENNKYKQVEDAPADHQPSLRRLRRG